jgi:thiamine biosynthesis lipoprotein
MARNRQGFYFWAVALCLVSAPVWGGWQSATDSAMGTRVHAEAWHADDDVAARAVAAVIAEMHRIDYAFSPYKTGSELSRLNREAPKRWVEVSDELYELLQVSYKVSELTGGAFDITFGSAGRHYDYRKGIAPDAETLEAAVAAIDYRHVQLDGARKQVRFAHPATYVDLGGIAKGHAVDRAASLLAAAGIAQGSVSAGGDSRILGDRRGQPWIVGVAHPRDPDALAVRLPLVDTAVSTSGDYERYFLEGDTRVHHILDPSSGRSARGGEGQGSMSVTILGPTGVFNDALSTSVFVLGPEDGMALINRLPGIDGIIIDGHGQMTYSADLQPPG